MNTNRGEMSCCTPILVSEEEFKIISTNFKKQAKNGKISRKDFCKVMTKHGGMGEDLANQLFDTFDTDHSGYVAR